MAMNTKMAGGMMGGSAGTNLRDNYASAQAARAAAVRHQEAVEAAAAEVLAECAPVVRGRAMLFYRGGVLLGVVVISQGAGARRQIVGSCAVHHSRWNKAEFEAAALLRVRRNAAAEGGTI